MLRFTVFLTMVFALLKCAGEPAKSEESSTSTSSTATTTVSPRPAVAKNSTPPGDAATAKTDNPAERRALCVIDDSLDMSGADGVNIDSTTGEVPMFAYFLPQLRCTDCLPWSKFIAAGLKTTVATQCDTFRLRRENLTMTSPLAPKIRSLLNQPEIDRNVIFITNALDWETRGSDKSFRVEMDLGADICSWIKSGRGVVMLGSATDNSGGIARRPLAIFAFGTTVLPPLQRDANTPEMFQFGGSNISNPASWLRAGNISVHSTFKVIGSAGNESIFGPGGDASVPIEKVSDVGITLNTRLAAALPSNESVTWLAAINDNDFAVVPSSRQADGSFDVSIMLGNVPMGGARFRIRLAVAPALVEGIERQLPKSHSLRRTTDTLVAQCRLVAPVRVERNGAASVSSLTINFRTVGAH